VRTWRRFVEDAANVRLHLTRCMRTKRRQGTLGGSLRRWAAWVNGVLQCLVKPTPVKHKRITQILALCSTHCFTVYTLHCTL
jgi:hypothetical protein